MKKFLGKTAFFIGWFTAIYVFLLFADKLFVYSLGFYYTSVGLFCSAILPYVSFKPAYAYIKESPRLASSVSSVMAASVVLIANHDGFGKAGYARLMLPALMLGSAIIGWVLYRLSSGWESLYSGYCSRLHKVLSSACYALIAGYTATVIIYPDWLGPFSNDDIRYAFLLSAAIVFLFCYIVMLCGQALHEKKIEAFAEQLRAEEAAKAKAEREEAERKRAEQEKAAREKERQEQAQRERAAREQAERETARRAWEQAQREKAAQEERARQAWEQAQRERANSTKAQQNSDEEEFFPDCNNRYELKRAFRILCKKYHTDNKITGDEETFIRMKNAYDRLYARMPA